MQKIGAYIIVLVIGAIIGLSMGIYVLTNQTQSMGEQVKITIQGIGYTTSEHSVLEIELVNNVPEKNLEGNVAVYQDEKQWTSEVTWYYTGYGVAEVICDSINETQNFRITYIENNPRATYLDRMIGWNEVESRTIGFMETSELTITDMNFVGTTSTDKNITLSVSNTGTSSVTISIVKVNGATASFDGDTTLVAGAPGTIAIPKNWTAGSKYSVSLFATDGTLVSSYTATA